MSTWADHLLGQGMPAALHGVIDNVRTTLTELIGELMAAVPRGQANPTAEQARDPSRRKRQPSE